MDKLPIAERFVDAVSPKGENIKLHLCIGAPRKGGASEWLCPVSVSGYNFVTPDIPGIDSWQALELAYKLVVDILCDFVKNGGIIYHLGREVQQNEIPSIF
ncbi:MAG: hypothetical protein KUG78_20565 [Kangiellaceae bacterium]|nr:hypothetical protein [Kangiellaceae bacterium]